MESLIGGHWESHTTLGPCGGDDEDMRPDRGGGAESPRRPAGWDEIESRNRMVQANLGLVRRVARQFLHRGLMIEDLIGEGNLGLIRAAEHYNPAIGTRFSTYATYWIRDAILSALANTATVRLPINIARLLIRWRRAERRLRQAQGHPPTFEEVAAALGLNPAMQRLISRAHRVSRVQGEAAPHDDSPSGPDLMPDEGLTAEQSLSDREERESVSDRLERLDATERAIVQLRFGLAGEPPLSVHQIAARLGMTTTAVHKAAAAAMRKLGRHPRADPLAPSDGYACQVG